MSQKTKEEKKENVSYLLYRDVAEYIREHEKSVKEACEVFGIKPPRFYFLQAKYKNDAPYVKKARKKAAKTTKTAAKEQPEEEVVLEEDEEEVETKSSSDHAILRYNVDDPPAVTPEVMPHKVSRDDLVTVSVMRARNVGAFFEQIIPLL